MEIFKRVQKSQGVPDPTGKGTCQVIFIRHGERADLAPEKGVAYDVKNDPPLTDLGIKQAQHTGQWLRNYIMEQKFDEIVIECSPFIRTMQTASHIAQSIKHPCVTVKYQYSEWLYPIFYHTNPILELYVRNRPAEEIQKTFLNGQQFTHNDEEGFNKTAQIYPEGDLFTNIERIFPTCQQLLNQYENSGKRVLHLVATHAATVKGFTQAFSGKFRKEWCHFCAFSGIEIEGKKWRLIFDEDDRHIKGINLDERAKL
ncbi:hypothetical protein FGO68_gene2757 [Halteria grandinella]|uniref:Histidine phosphatase family protein n=1 Tax=Halteria grandinella TaxID=5974 RepID=A0A8J8NJR5_HALGN|nr:hypothetical protein FGO68_gene2757 [Halteria grandinella]